MGIDRPAIAGGTPVRNRDHFLVFGAPALGQSEIDEVSSSMRSGWLGTGPKVAKFEEDFGRYIGATHCLAVNSCTAALHLSLIAAGTSSGNEVITTALTFAATANAVIHAGGTPVLVDVEPESMNIDPLLAAEAVTDRTTSIIPVHFAGRPCDMDALCDLCSRHGLKLIEDCAHAVETLYKGRHMGSFGDFGAFSFYVTKNLSTGEGGMVSTRSEENAARIKMLALHGLSRDAWKRFSDEGYKHYQVVECGFKYNMMDIQAAMGIHQLAKIEDNWIRRHELWERYMAAFSSLPVGLPAPVEEGTRHAHHLFTILVDESETGISRDRFLEAMTAENIGVGVHYLCLAEHPYYQEKLGVKPEQFPHATRIGRQTVSIPLSPAVTDKDADDVISAVHRIISYFAG